MNPAPVMLVEVADLSAIRIECQNCSSATVIRLNDRRRTIPHTCPACLSEFGTPAEEPLQALTGLLQALEGWRRVESGARATVRLRFELSPFGHMAPRPEAAPPAGSRPQ